MNLVFEPLRSGDAMRCDWCVSADLEDQQSVMHRERETSFLYLMKAPEIV